MVDDIVDNPRIAVIGLGEAGEAIATDLAAAGAHVTGWDPAVVRPPDGVRMAESAEAAAEGARALLCLTAAGPSLEVARALATVLVPGQLYADLNTAAPALKLELAAVVVPSGALFVDGALMGPVPGRGMRTPCLACGPGAAGFAELLRPLGMPVVVLGGEPGEAATRKLLRSVFMKGLAAAAIESLAAARAAGCEAWLYAEIADTFEGAGTALLERLVTASRRHAARRVQEMDAARRMFGDLGVPPRVSSAAAGWLSQLEREDEARQGAGRAS